MRERGYGKDTGLTIRMFFTSFLLLLLYCFFGLFLFSMGMPLELLLIIGIAMVAFQFFASDKLVLKSTGARVVSPEQEPKLHATVERLAALADMPKPKKIAIMETHVPNAFATGRSPNNAVIAVTRGLLSKLNEKELEAVLAHELSHIKNKDVMVLTWAGLIVVISGFLMQMLFWMSLFGGFGGRGHLPSGHCPSRCCKGGRDTEHYGWRLRDRRSHEGHLVPPGADDRPWGG